MSKTKSTRYFFPKKRAFLKLNHLVGNFKKNKKSVVTGKIFIWKKTT